MPQKVLLFCQTKNVSVKGYYNCPYPLNNAGFKFLILTILFVASPMNDAHETKKYFWQEVLHKDSFIQFKAVTTIFNFLTFNIFTKIRQDIRH